MTDDTLAIARAAQPLDRATLELARIETMNALDAAKERLDEASLAAALPGGDEKAMIAAEQEVARLRQKLQGLAMGLKRVEAAEKEQREAAMLVQRRADAVELLSLVDRRFWATQALDEALRQVSEHLHHIEHLGNHILLKTSNMTENDRRLFLLNIDCMGMADTVYRYNNRTNRLAADYSKGLPFTRSAALKALAKSMPEALDKAVQDEASALARAESESDG